MKRFVLLISILIVATIYFSYTRKPYPSTPEPPIDTGQSIAKKTKFSVSKKTSFGSKDSKDDSTNTNPAPSKIFNKSDTHLNVKLPNFFAAIPNSAQKLILDKTADFPDHLNQMVSYVSKHLIKEIPNDWFLYTYIDRMLYHLSGHLTGVIYIDSFESPNKLFQTSIKIEFQEQSGLFTNLSWDVMNEKISHSNRENDFIYYKAQDTRAIILNPKKSRYIIQLYEDYFENEVMYWGNLYRKTEGGIVYEGNIFLQNSDSIKHPIQYPGYSPFPSEIPQ